jgi:hypothetical protein
MKADSLFYAGLSLGLVAGIFKVLTEALIVVTSKCSEDEDPLNTGQRVWPRIRLKESFTKTE